MGKSEPKYKRQSHLTAVAKSSGAKGVGVNVLLYCCMMSEFDRPEVTVTKDQICDVVNAGRRAVAEGLKFLREEGTIKPKRGLLGGKHVPVTYELCVKGGLSAYHEKQAELDREKEFRALSRKFGPVAALEMMKKY